MSPGSCHFPNLLQVRAPFFDRHYPASSILLAHPLSACPDVCPCQRVVGRHHTQPVRQTAFVAHRIAPTHAIITTPAGPCISLACPDGGFLRWCAGSAPAMSLRGLLNVHSRYGLRGSLPSHLGTFPEVIQTICYLLARGGCFRSEREKPDGACTITPCR